MTQPSKQYIEYLQAHPELWAALNEEWEPEEWDQVYLSDSKEVGLVRSVGKGTILGEEGWTLGILLTPFFRGTATYFSCDVSWLPSLGDWLDKLRKAGSGTIKITDFGDRVVMSCDKGFAMGDKQEIAAAKLWGRICGIEK